jgi:hypothetical protein
MFGLEYLLALMKVFTQISFAIVSAIPFKIAWNTVASTYLTSYLPENLIHITYWKFVAIILTFTFIGECIQKITPKIISINNSNKKEEK